MPTCRKFKVKGRVQGVWFRESTRRQAAFLNLTGYAINLPDGSVEVLACGDSAAIDRLAEWLQQGPPLASVSSVDETGFEGDCPNTFSTG